MASRLLYAEVCADPQFAPTGWFTVSGVGCFAGPINLCLHVWIMIGSYDKGDALVMAITFLRVEAILVSGQVVVSTAADAALLIVVATSAWLGM